MASNRQIGSQSSIEELLLSDILKQIERLATVTGGGGGSGTVTSVSVVTANGFAGSVATATTTPAITISTTITGILKGNGTAISAAVAGTDYLTPSGSGSSLTGVWLYSGTGQSLTGAVEIIGSGTNTLKFVFNSLAVTPVNGAGLWVANTTAAAAGAQQISPSIVLEGQGWKTNATAETQSVKWRSYILPVQGALNPDAYLNFDYSINGAAYTNVMQLYAVAGGSISGMNMANLSPIRWGSNNDKSIVVNTSVMVLSTFAEIQFKTYNGSAYAERFRIEDAQINATSGTEYYTLLTANFSPTSGTATLRGHVVSGTINQTGGANGQITYYSTTPTITAAVDVTGYDWNPTTPANISGTHLAFRATSGLSIFGGTTAANAWVVLGAGTTTIAPLKLTSGTNLTTPVNGCMEYNGTNLFFTRTGAVREGVLTQSAVTTEVVVTDTTVTVNIGGVTYKLLARA